MYRIDSLLATIRLIALIAALPVASASSQTPPPRVQYPPTRTVDHADIYHGTRIADPYRWLEAIDSNSVAEWVKSQNAVTMPYLAALPGRDLLKQRITALYDFPRTGVPFWEGSRWFYTKNTGLQRQNVWYARRTLDGVEQVVLDPNQLSPDGSIALSGFSPSPDGNSLAYGLSEGGSDWVTYYVRDLSTGRGSHGIRVDPQERRRKRVAAATVRADPSRTSTGRPHRCGRRAAETRRTCPPPQAPWPTSALLCHAESREIDVAAATRAGEEARPWAASDARWPTCARR